MPTGNNSATMSSMEIRSQRGEINVLLVPLLLVVLLLVGAASFGFWAFSGRQDYKNNVDQKIVAAVAVAEQRLSTQKDKEFAEKEKSPLTSYSGPAAFGSVVVKYPKTWSAYVDQQNSGDTPVNGYFYPGVVPATDNQTTSFALRVQVLQQSYDTVLQNYSSYIEQRQVSASPYRLPKVPNVVGTLLTGAIQTQKQGSMVLLPLRNQTLQIWTESSQFQQDFSKYILPNFTFSP